MKKYDKWTWGTLTLLLLLFCIVIYFRTQNKLFGFSLSFFAILTAILYSMAAFSSADIVNNEFEGDLYIKPEEGSEPKLINPKENKYGLDGIASPYKKGYIYKVSNGIYVEVTRDGNIVPTSGISKILNSIGGGWKTTSDFKKSDLLSWQPLFNKSE